MALILKSNSVSSGSLGNVFGILGASDYTAFADFNRGIYRAKDANGEIKNSNIHDILSVEQPNITKYRDDNGQWQNAQPNTPRLHNIPDITRKGLLIEQGRKNLFLNSNNPATQTMQVVSVDKFQLVVEGTGSAVISGAVEDVTGSANENQPAYGKFTNGSVTVTISGNVTKCYLYSARGGFTFGDLTPIDTLSSVVENKTDLVTIEQTVLNHLNTNEFSVVMQIAFPKYDASYSPRSLVSLLRTYHEDSNEADADGYEIRANYTTENKLQLIHFETLNNDTSTLILDPASRTLTVAVKCIPNNSKVSLFGSLGEDSATDSALTKPLKILLGSRLQNVATHPAVGMDAIITKLVIFDRALTDSELSKISNSWV